jgi:hypothetical protein
MEGRMDAYPPEIERVMKRLLDSLGEKDRRLIEIDSTLTRTF